ncbi:DNA repair protein RecO [Candidatus Amarolinea dominans]|uniref:DNA repair protein RecO n=1 Tax=Candidatus Amarolinea dominans TaxID=3140696 RepID=UPI0031357FFE|nr:DNA repair protein RecO [Anaerolineae bacterium]
MNASTHTPAITTDATTSRRARVYRTEAVVLRRQDHGETDRLLTVFTPMHGKRVLRAKGVRKPTSRKTGHLELFAHSLLLVAKGHTWDLITQAELIHPFPQIHEDMLRANYAYYVAELVDRFTTEHDENRLLFDLLVATLQRLDSMPKLDVTLRFFELRLLNLVGYQPQLYHCVNCSDELQPVTNFWNHVGGGVLCPRCGEALAGSEELPLAVFKLLRFVQRSDFDTVLALAPSEALMIQTELLLQRYLMALLERNLKSVDFLRRMRYQATQPKPDRLETE